jgi:hypothetical protein
MQWVPWPVKVAGYMNNVTPVLVGRMAEATEVLLAFPGCA